MVHLNRSLILLLILLVLATVPRVVAAHTKKGRTVKDPPPSPQDPCANVPAVCRTNVNGARQLGGRTNANGVRVRGPDKMKRKARTTATGAPAAAARSNDPDGASVQLSTRCRRSQTAPIPASETMPVSVHDPPVIHVPEVDSATALTLAPAPAPVGTAAPVVGGPVAPPRVQCHTRGRRPHTAAGSLVRRGRAGHLQDLLQDFHPGDNAAPKQFWSFTIGASGSHCPRGWLNLMQNYMVHFNLKGAAALEKGGRNAILHVQAVIEVACATTGDGKEVLKMHMKHFFGWDVTQQQVKMTIHPLSEGQTFEHMLGYVQKDSGKPHYAIVTNDITDAELQAGVKAYNEVAGDYRLNKVILTKKGFVGRLWAYWHANFWPFLTPVDVVVLCMIRSGAYVADASWTTSPLGHGNDFARDAAWWVMSTRPARATLQQVRVVFWGWHEVPDGKKWRYFSSTRTFSDYLTPLEMAVSKIWYEHAEDYSAMCTVCFELRKVLQQQHLEFDKYDLVDGAFLRLFDAVYTDVINTGEFQDLQLPLNTRAFQRDNALHEAAVGEDLDDEAEDGILGEDLWQTLSVVSR